jgi:hypothetical protein
MRKLAKPIAVKTGWKSSQMWLNGQGSGQETVQEVADKLAKAG